MRAALGAVVALPGGYALFTDSIPYLKECGRVTILSVADMFAEAIRRVCHDESISTLYAIR